MEAIELWSGRDDDAVERCRRALDDAKLAHALLCLEQIPEHRRRVVQAKLDAWSGAVQRLKRLGGLSHHEALRRVLVDAASFIGECEDYYRPGNCLLSQVVQTRTGMPIMLSSIWMVVAHRAAIRTEGIGLPGHFIIRIAGPPPLYVDPFGSGRTMTKERCMRMVRQLRNLDWDDRYLAAVDHRDILARVLTNLLMCYQRRGHGRAMYRMARFSAMLFPACVEHQWTHARVTEVLELDTLAVNLYENIVTHFPSSTYAKAAAAKLADLTVDRRPLH
ncbi:MAG: transglutaminase-like domain-containing protein [Myxococcota bacterium]|nr:transglutaminase-like domain-containing protein [Myxococcota bacterium]